MPNSIQLNRVSMYGVFLLTLFVGACSSKSPTPLTEAQNAQRSAEDLVERTEESVDNIGGHLEDVNEQIRTLKLERDELRAKLDKQNITIQQLQQDLNQAQASHADAESRLANLRDQKAKLETELAREKQATVKPTAPLPTEQTEKPLQ